MTLTETLTVSQRRWRPGPAVVGGFVSQSMLHRTLRKAENRSRTANKLEAAGRLANAIRKSGLVLGSRAGSLYETSFARFARSGH